MNLIQGMVVSETIQHGRHLRHMTQSPDKTASDFSDIRISNVVFMPASNNRSLSNQDTLRTWEILDSQSFSVGESPLVSFPSNMNSIQSYGSDIVNDEVPIKDGRTNLKNEDTFAVSASIKEEVSKQIKPLEDKLDQVSKQINPLEDKLDHLSQLLERLIVANV